MTTQKKCSPGNYLCGARCISGKKNCKKNPSPDAQKAASELSDLITRVATGEGTKKDNKRVSQDKDIQKAVKQQQKKLEKKETAKPKKKSTAKKTTSKKKATPKKEAPPKKEAKPKEQEKGGALATTQESKPVAQQNQQPVQQSDNTPAVNDSDVIDVTASARTVSNRTSTRAEIRNENLRRRANQISDVAKTLFKAAAPTPEAGETQAQAINRSVARNAARATVGAQRAARTADRVGRRAAQDTRAVIDAIQRFRRNRR